MGGHGTNGGSSTFHRPGSSEAPTHAMSGIAPSRSRLDDDDTRSPPHGPRERGIGATGPGLPNRARGRADVQRWPHGHRILLGSPGGVPADRMATAPGLCGGRGPHIIVIAQMLLKSVAYCILRAPKYSLQYSAVASGGNSLQEKTSMNALSVSSAKCPDMQDVSISWTRE